MEAIEALLTRRSVRRFTDELVQDEDVTLLLRAAMQAPSAGNAQPWHFVAITDRSTLGVIPSFHPFAQMAAEAPLAILVCADQGLEKYSSRWPLDCAAAAENMLLAAHARGLGAVWLGEILKNAPAVSGLLGVPDNLELMAVLAVGRPKGTERVSSRKRPEELIVKEL